MKKEFKLFGYIFTFSVRSENKKRIDSIVEILYNKTRLMAVREIVRSYHIGVNEAKKLIEKICYVTFDDDMLPQNNFTMSRDEAFDYLSKSLAKYELKENIN